jgi:hypothetical protein
MDWNTRLRSKRVSEESPRLELLLIYAKREITRYTSNRFETAGCSSVPERFETISTQLKPT